MKQASKYSEAVQSILAHLDEPDKDGEAHQPPDPGQPIQEIDVYIEDDRITFIRKTPPQEQVIESTPGPPAPQNPAYPHIYALSVVYVMLLLAILTVQLWLVLHPPIATVTIIPHSQQITATGTLQLGRVIAPITLTQSQIVPTTGKGHQDARSAVGSITLYNGLFTARTVPAGTSLTGSDGVQVITDQTASIPAANPPSFGAVTVSAHALHTGSRGNIAAYDINQACCATAMKAVNTTPFRGGQDARDFRAVAANDLTEAATALKTTLAESMQAALQSQLQSGEALLTPACPPTVTADHHVGEEAVQLKVTVAETCSAVAYNSQELQGKATDLLTHQAVQTLGTGYSLIGDIQVRITQAEVSRTIPTLTFTCQGTWAYALSQEAQEHLKTIIAGKTKQEAIKLLLSLPGIEQASIQWDEQTTLPGSLDALHLVILV